MADGISLGSANLDLTADLAPLALDLDRAKAKCAAAVAEMQAMLDSLHADADVGVGVSHVGSLGGLSAMDRGFSVEHLAATRDLADAFREHTQVTRDLLAAGPAGRSGDTVVTGVGGHTSGIYGVRGASAPGSVSNPIVVVMEAASRTPLGALAAAVGEDTISQGDQRTVVATTQGSETRIAAAGAPGTATDAATVEALKGRRNQLAEELKAAQWAFQGTENRNISGSPAAEARIAAAVQRLNDARTAWETAKTEHATAASAAELAAARRPAEGSPFQALANIEAAKSLAATPGAKPVAVNIAGTDPSVSRAEGDATAVAMEDVLAKLAGKSLAPGQRASSDLLSGYPAFGYRVGVAPSSPFPRLYGPGGKVGTTEYGVFPGTEGDSGHGGLDALLASSGGKGGSGGGGGFHLGGGIGPFRWSSGGGGGEEGLLRRVLFGSSWLPATAGIGTIGSFAGFGPEHALLTLGGMAGSGVAALGGGALLAGGAAAKLGAGMGADLAVSSSAIADTSALYKNYEKLREAVAQYGKSSSQAKEAQEELTTDMKYTLSGTKGVTEELHLAEKVSALNVQWDKQTSGARVAFVHLAEPLIEIASKWIPLINTSAEHNFASMASNLKPFFSYLKGPEAMGIFQQLENEFHAEIPTAMHALDEGFQVFGKTISYIAPLTGKLLEDVDHFFTKLNTPSGFAKWEGMMTRLIGDFNVWKAFLKELGGALVDLFDKDAKTGESIIETLTVMLHHVREYEQSVTGGDNIRNIFTLHREEIIALIHALAPLGDAFAKVYIVLAQQFVPVATVLARLIGDLVRGVSDIGPFGDWALALGVIAYKLQLLKPLLAETKAEFLGNATAAETDAAANQTLAASAGLAASGAVTEGAAFSGLGLELAGGGGVLLKKGAFPSPSALFGGANASEGALGGLSGLLTKSNLIRGGIGGVLGGLVTSQVGNAVGLHGTASSLASIAGVGVGAGLMTGNPLVGVGAAFIASTPYLIKGIGDLFNAGHAAMERESAHVARNAISMLGTTITPEVASKRSGEVAKRLAEAGAAHAEAKHREAESSLPIAGAVVGLFGESSASSLRAKALKKEREAGELAAKAFHEGYEHVRFPTTFGFLHMALGELDKLTPEARRSAAQTMIAYAAELEHQGKLGKGSVGVIIKDLEQEFPQLEAYLRAHGHSTGVAFADALSLKAAQESLHGTLHSIEMEWGLTYSNIAQTEKDLLYTIQHTHGVEKELAEQELKEVQTKYATQWRERAQLVKDSAHEQEEAIHRLSVNMPNLGEPGFTKYGDMVTQWTEHLSERVGNGVETLEQGVTKINKMLEGELTELGAPKSVGHALVTGKMPTAKQFFTESPVGHAVGGLVQIGQPGMAGHDTVPLNIGGQGIMVGEGEQVAVFNRHQLPIVNAALADMGGLPGLFSQVTTPNYMASGGIVAPTVPGHGAMTAVVRAGLADVAKAANAKVGKASAHAGAKGGRGGSIGHYSGSWVQVMKQIAKAKGWSLADWEGVLADESGGVVSAQNPTSTAFGLGQLLNMNWPTYGGGPGSNGVEQIEAMARYIAATYGNPTKALAHEGAFKWYSHGGLVGFARGGLPHVIGSHAQKTTPVPRNFGQGAHTKKGGANKHKTSKKLSGKVPGIVWPAPVAELEDLINKEIPIASEAYGAVGNEISLHEYGSGELAFILTEGPLGEQVTPYENLANVEGRLGQLHKLANTEGNYHALLEKARGTIGVLNVWVAKAIKEREELIKKLKERIARLQKQIDKARHTIEENLKEIRTLNASISKVEHHISSLEGHPKKNATAIKSAKAELSKLHSERHGLEAQNKELGGSDTSIGEGGKLHVWEGQREAYKSRKEGREQQVAGLKEHGKTWGEDLTTIQGVGGSGGELGESALTLAKLAKEEEELGVGSMAKSLAKAKLQAGPGAGEQELTSLLKQQNEQLAAQFAVSQDQYKVLANLPPFGGSFASGGIVPGPPGAPRLVVAHGGEGIGAPGGAQVHMHFANGMEWLKNYVRAEIKQETRNMTRGPSRPIPSRGGGLLT